MMDSIYQSSFLSLELNHASANYDQTHLQATKHQIIDTVKKKTVKKKKKKKKKKRERAASHNSHSNRQYWVIQKRLTDQIYVVSDNIVTKT